MRTCYQFKEQNVLQHGEAVAQWFSELYNFIAKGVPLTSAWRLPDWVSEENFAIFLEHLPGRSILEQYHRYHDCGKPFCLQLDEEGRQHFPNHAEVSYETYLSCGGDVEIAELIRSDMAIHTLKAEGLGEFCKNPNAIALLLTGLAEVHSNAQMFGGIESDSFKMKIKNIDRRGRQIVKTIKEQLP